MIPEPLLLLIHQGQRVITVKMSRENTGLIAKVFHDRTEIVFIAQMNILAPFRVFDHFR